MKQKVLWGLFFCLFICNMAAYAIQDRYLKHVAIWKDYPYSSAFDIDVEHNILFIGVGDEIRIHDANDLTDNARPICTIPFEANVYDLLYADGFLYICNDDFGIFVYDIIDISQPSVVYRDQACLFAKALHANKLYMIVFTDSFDSNLSIYQIESPSAIQLISRIQLPDLTEIESVFIHEQYVYVVDHLEGIIIYSLADLLDNFVQPIGQFDNHSDLKHLLFKDQIGYISDRDTGFSIIDFTNPEMYQEFACIDKIQSAIGSAIVEQYAYVATHETQRIWVMNIENPNDIKVIDECPLDYEAYRIHAGNDHIFVSSFSHMYIYQLTQGFPEPQFHANPRFGYLPLNVFFSNTSSGDILTCKWDFGDGYTSTTNQPNHTYTQPGQYTVTLTVSSGTKWYTETKTNYISVYQTLPSASFEMDIQSRVCPLYIKFIQKSSGCYTSVHWDFGDGHTSMESEPLHVFETTGTFYVTLTIFAMNDAFQYSQPVYVRNNVFPIADWTSKTINSFCADTQKKYGFAGTADGIDVLDISNPLAISTTQSIQLTYQPESFFYTHNYLLAACGEGGLSIFDTSNPKHIFVVSQVPTDSTARHVWMTDSYAYISTNSGVSIFDLHSISKPIQISTIETFGEAYAMKQSDQYAFVADAEKGLFFYQQENGLDFSRPSYFSIDNLVQFDFDMDYVFLAIRETGVVVVKYNNSGDLLSELGATKNLNAAAICVRNDYAFIACEYEGFSVYDVKEKDDLKPMKQFQSNGSACDVVDVYPYVFLIDGDGGIRIFVQPEQNQLTMQTPRTIISGHHYKGEVCLPYVQRDFLTIDLQANQYVSMLDESIGITQGQLCRNFSFVVDKIPDNQNIADPQVHFKAWSKGWFDANSYSFMTKNEMIKTYTASNLPLSIPDEESGISVINIADEGTIECLSVQIRIQIVKLEDLLVTLISPQNDVIILFDCFNPGENIETIEINLDDRASQKISDAKFPLTGFYQPEGNFSSVKGKSIKGEWTLYIEDKARYNATQLLGWSMFIELSAVNSQPMHVNQNKSNLLTSKTQTRTQKIEQISTKPVIQLIDVPPIGNRIRPMTGMIHNVVNFSGFLSIYILTDSWHLKPRWNTPITDYDQKGRWKCDITTKWGDENATKIAVFLFSRDRQPLLMADFPVLPQTFFQKAIDHKIYDRQK
jgi:PKD repeat protein/subtilisin-like proprotein convertase family protein